MPTQIAALPTVTPDGIPVTWASAWTSELTTVIRVDPLLKPITGAHTPAYFTTGRPRDGEPCVTKPHPERVRQSAIQDICQICGRHIGDGPHWICDIRLGQNEIRIGNRIVPLLIDSWTCGDCIEYSLVACPNLARRPALNVLRVHEWLLVPTIERPKWIPDEVPYGPIGFVKIAALSYDIKEGA